MMSKEEYQSICIEIMRQKHNLHLQGKMDLDLFIDNDTYDEIKLFVNSQLQAVERDGTDYRSFYGCELHRVRTSKKIIKVVDLSE